jgi:SAM-dependent methyltransferase
MMLEGWEEVLGCPSCQSALEVDDDARHPVTCPGCGERFSFHGQIPALLDGQEADRLKQAAEAYRAARLREGWEPMTPGQAQRLPYGQPRGYPTLYWLVRRQSFCALMSLLAREGPTPADGPVADLGAGIGWLSYRLAQIGHRVVAVEASVDPDLGLAAAEANYLSQVGFQLVQGNLERPPFQPETVALIVFNASLHYATDLERTLERAAHALQPGGRLIVLDTPISVRPRPGTGRGDRHLGRLELEDALHHAGLRPRWIKIRRGVHWQLHQAKAFLRRDPRFSFPMVVADRT